MYSDVRSERENCLFGLEEAEMGVHSERSSLSGSASGAPFKRVQMQICGDSILLVSEQ